MSWSKQELKKLQDWTRKVTRAQRDSTVFLDLWNDQMATDPSKDPVPVMQLGYAMLLDQPIVIIARIGSTIPENVKRVARAVEFFDEGSTESLHAATIRAMRAIGIEVKH